MSLKSVYLPDPAVEQNQIRIQNDEHHHLVVGRVEKGESIEIFDGRGNVWTAVVSEVRRRETIAEVQGTRYIEPEPIQVILGLPLIRASAFELALEKVVEIGVNRVVPFVAARSNTSQLKSVDRLTRIIVEAAKQSKRYHLPVLEDVIRFDQIVSRQAALKIMFAERGGGSLKSADFQSPVLYLVGPEGGWTDVEATLARQHGFVLATLGGGILRTETAAVVGGAIIRYETL